LRTFFQFILFSSLFCFSATSQTTKLRTYVDSKQFYAPGIGNYIEVYFQFSGPSVSYKGVESGLKGELAISLSVSDGTSTIAQNAYRLETPLMKDSIVEDFYDVQRFALNPGKYTLSLELLDLNSDQQSIKASMPLIVEEFNDAISMSDIEIAESITKSTGETAFSKSGVMVIPRLSTFYPTELTTIPVYFELYNTNLLDENVFGLRQLVRSEDGSEITDLTSFSRHDTASVIPIIKKVDITSLATGKYTLSYTILSRNMTELATQSYEFERSNDVEVFVNTETIVLDPRFQSSLSDDSVAFYLASLIPISGPAEVKNIITSLKSKDTDRQRKHIQAFWKITSPNSTYDSWMKYKLQVQLVEKLYSNNFQVGYETDRGRVYLQYGSPTTLVERENSPTEYPYEIWQYNRIGNFNNKRFIFYNPDLVNNTYRLLHSDMIGELKNPGWPQALSKRNTHNGNVDDPNMFNQNHFGGNSNDLFRQY
jgi:GWxTD domain-containing protein